MKYKALLAMSCAVCLLVVLFAVVCFARQQATPPAKESVKVFVKVVEVDLEAGVPKVLSSPSLVCEDGKKGKVETKDKVMSVIVGATPKIRNTKEIDLDLTIHILHTAGGKQEFHTVLRVEDGDPTIAGGMQAVASGSANKANKRESLMLLVSALRVKAQTGYPRAVALPTVALHAEIPRGL